MIKKSIFSILVLGLFFLLAPTVFSQEPSNEAPSADEINSIAVNLNCPTCAGLNLADCRTQTCAQWRDQIGDMLAEGQTPDEIIAWYAQNYGVEVLQEPPRQGVGLFVWLLPIIALLFGIGVYIFLIKNWTKRKTIPASASASSAKPLNNQTQTSGATQPTSTDDYLHRVEQELKDLS